LHCPVISVSVPSASITASSKNSAGCAPDSDARLVDRPLQRVNVGLGEPPAEIARGRGVRDALRAERIQVRLVLAPQLDILQARPAASHEPLAVINDRPGCAHRCV